MWRDSSRRSHANLQYLFMINKGCIWICLHIDVFNNFSPVLLVTRTWRSKVGVVVVNSRITYIQEIRFYCDRSYIENCWELMGNSHTELPGNSLYIAIPRYHYATVWGDQMFNTKSIAVWVTLFILRQICRSFTNKGCQVRLVIFRGNGQGYLTI